MGSIRCFSFERVLPLVERIASSIFISDATNNFLLAAISSAKDLLGCFVAFLWDCIWSFGLVWILFLSGRFFVFLFFPRWVRCSLDFLGFGWCLFGLGFRWLGENKVWSSFWFVLIVLWRGESFYFGMVDFLSKGTKKSYRIFFSIWALFAKCIHSCILIQWCLQFKTACLFKTTFSRPFAVFAC